MGCTKSQRSCGRVDTIAYDEFDIGIKDWSEFLFSLSMVESLLSISGSSMKKSDIRNSAFFESLKFGMTLQVEWKVFIVYTDMR